MSEFTYELLELNLLEDQLEPSLNKLKLSSSYTHKVRNESSLVKLVIGSFTPLLLNNFISYLIPSVLINAEIPPKSQGRRNTLQTRGLPIHKN